MATATIGSSSLSIGTEMAKKEATKKFVVEVVTRGEHPTPEQLQKHLNTAWDRLQDDLADTDLLDYDLQSFHVKEKQ